LLQGRNLRLRFSHANGIGQSGNRILRIVAATTHFRTAAIAATAGPGTRKPVAPSDRLIASLPRDAAPDIGVSAFLADAYLRDF